MASVSKIILVGNVGREPELKMTPTGRAVCEFSIAVNRITGRSDSGERTEQTDWYRISCWAGLAERAQQMISKGRLVYVEGRFTPRTYVDREGKDRISLDVSASDFQMLDARRDREGGMGGGGAPAAGADAPKGSDGDKGFDPDEIPF
jgi:single-strand DNA-binding protein